MESYKLIAPGFDVYIDAANQTSDALLSENIDLVKGIRNFDEFFRNELWPNNPRVGAISMVLLTNAYMGFLAGVRMALSGHTAAVFPLLRTALESTCYAVIAESDPTLEKVWMDRHRGKAERRECSNKFSVSNARKLIEPKLADFESLIGDLYDGAIDYGAHPNIKGVFGHVTIDEDSYPEHNAVTLTSLYSETHHETYRGLMACMDFAFIIFVIAVLVPSEPNEELLTKTLSLNELKESIVINYIGEHND